MSEEGPEKTKRKLEKAARRRVKETETAEERVIRKEREKHEQLAACKRVEAYVRKWLADHAEEIANNRTTLMLFESADDETLAWSILIHLKVHYRMAPGKGLFIAKKYADLL